MEALVEKQGSSLILRIPHEVELALDLKEGDAVEMTLEDSSLVVTRKNKLPGTFEELWGDYPATDIELEIKGTVGDEGKSL